MSVIWRYQMRIIGIDPGQSGAIAVLDEGKVTVSDMPCNSLGVSYARVIEMLKLFMNENTFVFIERQDGQGMRTSSKAAFKMGWNYANIWVAISELGIKAREIKPCEWKRSMGLLANKSNTTAEKKKITAEMVRRIYPDADIYGKRGSLLDGRADAIMIAEYGMRLLGRKI